MKNKEVEFKIDKDGTWSSDYGEVKHPRIKRYLSQILKEENGNFTVSDGKSSARVKVEETPFFVEAIREEKKAGKTTGILLIINDDTIEKLDPSTLKIKKDNSIICKIKNGRFKAKFTLSAYWQLIEHVIEEEGKFYLKLGDKKWPLEAESD